MMQITTARLLLGLSAIATGLEQIKRGQIDAGRVTAQAGCEFLRDMLGDGAAQELYRRERAAGEVS